MMPPVAVWPGRRTLNLPGGASVVADRAKDMVLRLATRDRAPATEQYFPWTRFGLNWDAIPHELTVNGYGFVLRAPEFDAWYIQRVWCSDPQVGVRLRVRTHDPQPDVVQYVSGPSSDATLIDYLRVRRDVDTLVVEVITPGVTMPVIVIRGVVVGGDAQKGDEAR